MADLEYVADCRRCPVMDLPLSRLSTESDGQVHVQPRRVGWRSSTMPESGSLGWVCSSDLAPLGVVVLGARWGQSGLTFSLGPRFRRR